MTTKKKQKVIVIMGPTAVGKTALGIRLAQQYNGEIISGDSQQVYRQLAIGTAKATVEEQAAAVHHLIDVRDVTETYSAYDFVEEAEQAIRDISSRGKLPILVGGTGLYLQSLLEGYHLGGKVNQSELLAYRRELETLDNQELEDRVIARGLVIPQLNRRRMIRALELDQFGQDMVNQKPDYEPLCLALSDERELLYKRINKRVDDMMAQGLLEEARWLYETYPTAQAAKGIGYKELFPYFQGEQTLEEAVEKLKQQTRRFAKRQLTWFRNRMQATFYTVSSPTYEAEVTKTVRDFLAK